MNAGVLTLAAALLGALVPARAETVATFYQGRQIKVIVGNAVGADYDLGARLLARHMSKYVPGAPDAGRAEHAGLGQHRRRQLHHQRGAEGWQRVRFGLTQPP